MYKMLNYLHCFQISAPGLPGSLPSTPPPSRHLTRVKATATVKVEVHTPLPGKFGKCAFTVLKYYKFQIFGHQKLCCNLPKIKTKRTDLRVLCQKNANVIANSEDPDQTAPLGAV